MKSNINIGIAGNIGVGKTTLTKKIAKDLHFEPIFESVIDNPYLEDFYTNMERWSFNLQIYFLYTRFKDQLNLLKSKKNFIQDRTIYEDKEIFAYNLFKLGNMTSCDYDTYCNLFNCIVKFIKEPDLIIYLRANTDTLISRIKERKRDYEVDISSEYLHRLNISYEKWISKINQEKVLIIETDDFNIHTDKKTYKIIIDKIKNRINNEK